MLMVFKISRKRCASLSGFVRSEEHVDGYDITIVPLVYGIML
jgi:hypothetical protein